MVSTDNQSRNATAVISTTYGTSAPTGTRMSGNTGFSEILMRHSVKRLGDFNDPEQLRMPLKDS